MKKSTHTPEKTEAFFDFPAYIAEPSSFLNFLYSKTLGRMLLAPMVSPTFSKLAGKFMDSELSTRLIGPFIRRSHIKMAEYETAQFTSFNQFFTRSIKKEARPIDKNPTHLMSPADAKLTVFPITSDAVFFIKGVPYSTEHLLRSKRTAERFHGGYCYIFRLCVDDFHRYSFPDDGVRTRYVHIAGAYHTVQPIALDYADIYRQNTREYALLRTKHFKDMIFMQVGAMLVGRISNRQNTKTFKRGEEAGHFDYGGSTVILLCQKDAVFVPPILLDRSAQGIESVVKMGQCIGVSPKCVK